MHEQQLDLGAFLRRNLLLIVGTAILCAVLTVVALLVLPKKYESYTSVYVMSTDDLLGAFQSAIEGFGLSAGNDDRKGYVLAILNSSELKSAVLDKLDKEQKDEFWDDAGEDERTPEDAWERMDDLVRVESAVGSEPITIYATTEYPKLSEALAKHYLDFLLSRVNSDNRLQEKFLAGQLASAREDLKKASLALQVFQEKSELPFTVEAQGQAEYQALIALYTEQARAEVELSATRKQLEAPGDLPTQLALVAQRMAYEARSDLLNRMVETQSKSLERMPAIINKYASLKRTIGEKEKVVETLATQYELAKIQVVKTTTPYRVVVKPFLPERPVKKHLGSLGIGALIIGGMLGLGGALFKEALTARVPPPDEAV